MIKVIKGTSIGWDKESLRNDKNSLGLSIVSICNTWELLKKRSENTLTREEGKIKKAHSGLVNDIHNLAITIDMMKLIINRAKIDKDINEKDTLYLNVLLESYFTNLRSIFDFTTLTIRVALSDESISRLPSRHEDSLSAILKFAKNPNNDGVIPSEVVEVLVEHEDVFRVVQEIRDLIIHKGDEAIIYKEKEELTFGFTKLVDGNFVNIVENILGVESCRYPLFDYLSELTNRVFHYMEDLASALYVNFCRIQGENIPIWLSALEGICIPNFVEFLACSEKE